MRRGFASDEAFPIDGARGGRSRLQGQRPAVEHRAFDLVFAMVIQGKGALLGRYSAPPSVRQDMKPGLAPQARPWSWLTLPDKFAACQRAWGRRPPLSHEF
jgi:hypothetical protein